MESIVGAIDIGSNAMRAAVGVIKKGIRLDVLESKRFAVSLGRSVFADSSRAISDDVLTKAHEIFEEFAKLFCRHQVTKFRAVGTSALRDASNQEAFVKIAQEHGIALEVITGEEEGRIIRRAVQHETDLSNLHSALIDIGGGSVEFTILDKGEAIFCVSERLGTIRLLKSLSQGRISTDRFSDRVARAVEKLAEEVKSAIGGRKLDILLGTGGNVEALGELRTKIFAGKKKDNKIRFDELCAIIELLEPLSTEERQERFSLRPDRADVILPAAIILREVMRCIDMKKLSIPKIGLKEGILIELLGL